MASILDNAKLLAQLASQSRLIVGTTVGINAVGKVVVNSGNKSVVASPSGIVTPGPAMAILDDNGRWFAANLQPQEVQSSQTLLRRSRKKVSKKIRSKVKILTARRDDAGGTAEIWMAGDRNPVKLCVLSSSANHFQKGRVTPFGAGYNEWIVSVVSSHEPVLARLLPSDPATTIVGADKLNTLAIVTAEELAEQSVQIVEEQPNAYFLRPMHGGYLISRALMAAIRVDTTDGGFPISYSSHSPGFTASGSRNEGSYFPDPSTDPVTFMQSFSSSTAGFAYNSNATGLESNSGAGFSLNVDPAALSMSLGAGIGTTKDGSYAYSSLSLSGAISKSDIDAGVAQVVQYTPLLASEDGSTVIGKRLEWDATFDDNPAAYLDEFNSRIDPEDDRIYYNTTGIPYPALNDPFANNFVIREHNYRPKGGYQSIPEMLGYYLEVAGNPNWTTFGPRDQGPGLAVPGGGRCNARTLRSVEYVSWSGGGAASISNFAKTRDLQGLPITPDLIEEIYSGLNRHEFEVLAKAIASPYTNFVGDRIYAIDYLLDKPWILAIEYLPSIDYKQGDRVFCYRHNDTDELFTKDYVSYSYATVDLQSLSPSGVPQTNLTQVWFEALQDTSNPPTDTTAWQEIDFDKYNSRKGEGQRGWRMLVWELQGGTITRLRDPDVQSLHFTGPILSTPPGDVLSIAYHPGTVSS
jgi:hypothetical protein